MNRPTNTTSMLKRLLKDKTVEERLLFLIRYVRAFRRSDKYRKWKDKYK